MKQKEIPNFEGFNIFYGNVDSGIRPLRTFKEINMNIIKSIAVSSTMKNFNEYFELMLDVNKISKEKFDVIKEDINSALFRNR